MIGLLIKDFSIIKKPVKIAIVILFFAAVWAFYDKNAMMFAYMSILFGIFLPMTAIGYDERSQWHKYAISMPIKRSYLVVSKYILGVLTLSISIIVFFLLNILIDTSISMNHVQMGLAILSGGMIFLSIYLPICFRFGTEKARYLIILVSFTPTTIILILKKLNIVAEPNSNTLLLIYQLLPVIGLIVLFLSVMISIHVIKNKEY